MSLLISMSETKIYSFFYISFYRFLSFFAIKKCYLLHTYYLELIACQEID